MDVSVNKLFLYDEVHQLLFCDGRFTCIDMDNGPMNRKPLKVHKGVDNTLKFRVLGPDRAPVNICSYTMYARIVNSDNNELVTEKMCRSGSATGMVFLDLDEGDLQDAASGYYSVVIVGQQDFVAQTPGDYTATPFFTDFDTNVQFTLEITEQAQRNPIPSTIIEKDNWTPLRWFNHNQGVLVSTYYTSAIPTSRVRNHTHSTQTFSVYSDSPITGILEVLATLDDTPNPDPERGWFRVMVTSASSVLELRDFVGTEAYSFQANYMWLKFRYTPGDYNPQHGMSNVGVPPEELKIPKKILVRS